MRGKVVERLDSFLQNLITYIVHISTEIFLHLITLYEVDN